MSVNHETTQSPQSTGLDTIGFLVSEATGVSLLHIKGRQRERRIVNARALISQMARSQNFTFPEIAKWMDKDHTTIMHHMKIEV